MKPREERRKVLIDARLRHDGGWSDTRILNLSRRGLMARACEVPERGTYVEISRGNTRIVARVIWTRNDQFGARTQDSIAIEALAKGGDHPSPAPAANRNDRREITRGPDAGPSEERSRRLSRRLEFLAVAALGCAAAVLASDAVGESLKRPLRLIEGGMAKR